MPLDTPVLVSPRLELSAGQTEDAENLYPFVHGEPGRVVTDMLLWDGPETIADLRTYYEEYEAKEEPDWFEFTWVVRDRSGSLTGEMRQAIGAIGARLPTPPGAAEIGYWIAPPYQRQGLMSEAIHTVSTYAFDRWGSRSVAAEVFTNNEASQRLLEKLGFRNVDTLPQRHQKRGKPMDCYRYEVLPGQLAEI